MSGTLHYKAQRNIGREHAVDREVHRLERQQSRASSPARRFSILSSIDGFEIVDSDGRPVATREFQHEADGIVADLNKAVQGGPKALIAAITDL